MATNIDVIAAVRQKLRDFPSYFQTDVSGDGVSQIFEMPYVMIEESTLQVSLTDSTLATPQTRTLNTPTDYTLDAHHGTLMLVGTVLKAGQTLSVFGQHYQWFIDADITAEIGWYAPVFGTSINSATFFTDLATTDPRFELIVRGVLVACLWDLLIEASLDIDVRNPEGVDMPVSQRFAQLQNLVQIWTARYQELAEKLNIGLDRIQMLTLRRTSLSTGRLVPVYQAQEFDDRTQPTRMYPVIDNDQFLSDNPSPPAV